MVTAFAAACHEFVEPEINDVLDESRLISVNLSQAQTKITNEDIDQQRFVVYIYVDGEKVSEFQNPYNLVYDEYQQRWRFQKSGNWVDLFWNETGEHQFYAFNDVKYYAYGLGYTPLNYDDDNGAPRINLSGINLLQGSNLYDFDLIYAKEVHDVESEGYGSITLPFHHAFSSMLFEVKNDYPVEMSISSISLENIRATSANTGYYLSFADGLERQGNTADTYSGGSLTIAPGESAIAFGGSVLAWPQGFGGSPLINLEFNETSKTVDIRSLGIYLLDTGYKYHSTITLAPMDLDLEVKELVREYVGGVLKSKLTLSLSANKDLSEISDLQITVNKKGGESLGTYTIGTVSSNEVVVEGVADMEVGVYTISYSFKDGIGHAYNDSFDFPATTPRPAQQQFNYIYADGSQGNDVEGKNIVGVIIYHGNPKERFEDTNLPDDYCKGLAISLTSRKCLWNTTALSSIPTEVKVMTTVNLGGYFTGGYTTAQKYGSNNYTVFANGEAPSGTSGWYLPAANEWNYIYPKLENINSLLSAAGGDEIVLRAGQKSDGFWLPYFYSKNAAYVYSDANGNLTLHHEQWYSSPGYEHYVRPIFAF